MSSAALNYFYANSLNYIRPSKNETTHKAATKEEMQTVTQIIKSTAEWYRPIVHKDDFAEHNPDSSWIERNWKLRDFFLQKWR